MVKKHHRTRGPFSWQMGLVAGIVLLMALSIGWRLSTRSTPDAAMDTTQFPTQWVLNASEVPPGLAERVQLVYFHRTQRCQNCLTVERLTRQTLDAYFTDRMASGLISLTSLDVQAPKNAVFAEKYGAIGSSLYFNVRKGGVEYVCLEAEIWSVLYDETEFMTLLRDKILSVLGES